MKPAKHLKLGLSIKTLTGSRRNVEILNRLGHGPSYTTIEEIETELAYTAVKNGTLLPEGLSPTSHLHTGVAFDNNDRFVDTLNGRDTMHDTVVKS